MLWSLAPGLRLQAINGCRLALRAAAVALEVLRHVGRVGRGHRPRAGVLAEHPQPVYPGRPLSLRQEVENLVHAPGPAVGPNLPVFAARSEADLRVGVAQEMQMRERKV